MSVTSFPFFCFFIISLFIYYLLPRSWQWCMLLVFSVFFFLCSGHPLTILYLLAGAAAAHLCAVQMAASRQRRDGKRAFRFLICGLAVNLGILAALKYSNFLIENISLAARLFHAKPPLHELHLAAPIGLSFYAVQVTGYLLDVYWDITPPQRSLLKTLLFAGFYPQLTSGPIARYAQVKDSLYGEHAFDSKRISDGLLRMLWGVFKKLVISVRAGVIVDTIYADTGRYNGLYIWLAAVLFMLQLYTDCPGCMDIIIGAAECYGVTLPENFRTPFFSQTVQEYWQRWHSTLGEWLKDYVLYPILRSKTFRNLPKKLKKHFSKKASRQIPTYLAMLCVWLLIGLWHGGNWKFIIGMGLWFWVIIVWEQVSEPFRMDLYDRFQIRTDCFSWHFLCSLRVLILVSIGNMFFRLNGFITSLRTIKRGFSHWNPELFFDGSLFTLGLDGKDFFVLLFGFLILLVVSGIQETGSVREKLSGQNLVFRWAVILLLFAAVLVFGVYGPGYEAQSFIYEAF